MLRLPIAFGVFFVSLAVASPAVAQECFPACRDGFACVKGACVSACNPPCGAGSRCEKGDCTPAAAAVGPVQPRQSAVSTPPAAAATTALPPAKPVPAPGAQLHDGFYLRLALGLGYGVLKATREAPPIGLSDSDSVSGVAVASEALLGGTIVPGLVLGGGVESTILPKLGGGSTHAITTAVYGPFVDWYFDPRRGLHAQLMVGLGTAAPTDGSGDTETGIGVCAAIGQDWFISDEWSAGIAGRLQYARFTDQITYPFGVDDTPITVDLTSTFVIPSVLATFTYH